MASTMNNSLELAVDGAVELDEVCDEMSTAPRAQTSASDGQRRQRWQALDRLLAVSFGAISPAYLFTSFPLDR